MDEKCNYTSFEYGIRVCVCVCVCVSHLYNKERAVQENFNHLSLSNILLEVYMSCMRCPIETIKPIDPGGSC